MGETDFTNTIKPDIRVDEQITSYNWYEDNKINDSLNLSNEVNLNSSN